MQLYMRSDTNRLKLCPEAMNEENIKKYQCRRRNFASLRKNILVNIPSKIFINSHPMIPASNLLIMTLPEHLFTY